MKISVIIPCYNSGKFVVEAVRSVLAPEGPRMSQVDLEVLVVDDHSNDPETLTALNHIRTMDCRIRILTNDGVQGAAAARNTGLRQAIGDWISFLDADDILLPHAFEVRLEAAECYPNAGLISADFVYLYEDGSRDSASFYTTRSTPKQIFAQTFNTGEPLYLSKPINIFLDTVLVWTGVIMVKASLLKATGMFDESLERWEDDHLWIRLARVSDLVFVPQVIALYRQHPASITKRVEPPASWGIISYRKLLNEPGFEEYRALILRRIARFHAQNTYYHRRRGEHWLGFKEALQWVKLDISSITAWKNLAATVLGK